MKNDKLTDRYIFKKKHTPAFLSLTSLVLAIIWIFIVLAGVIREFDVESIKSLNGKKIVFSLEEHSAANSAVNKDEEKAVTNNDASSNIQSSAELKEIAVVVEFEDFSLLDNLLSSLSETITLGLSPDVENFLHVKEKLNSLKNDYIIKLPLSNSYINNPYNIYPNIDPTILTNRLDYLLSGSKAVGVYNIGNEEYLESDLTNFANIIATLNQKNLFLLYGVNGYTTVFESDKENIFSVDACDQVVDVRYDNKYQIIEKLSFFENIANDKGKAILFVKAVNYNLPDEVVNWLQNIEYKNFKIVPVNKLPKVIYSKDERY